MADTAVTLLTTLSPYLITLIVLVILFVLTLLSDELKRNIGKPLKYFIVIWVILFGVHVYAGKDIYTLITEPSQADLDAARLKKVKIDGRDVTYDKYTNEIINKKKK